MGIPSRKAISEWMDTSKLELGDKAATICRQAMEWAEGADPKPTLERYYERETYGLGQGLYHSLDYYRGNRVDVAMKIMDKAMETFGVEYVPSNRDTVTRPAGFEYLNTGDTYGATIIYDRGAQQWLLGTWGGMVEADERRFGVEKHGWFENPDDPEFIPPGLRGIFQIYGPLAMPVYVEVMRRAPVNYFDVWNVVRTKQPESTPSDVLLTLESLAREGVIVDLGGDTFGKW